MGKLLYDKKRLDKHLEKLNAQQPEPTEKIRKLKEQIKKVTVKAKALVVKNSLPKTGNTDARYAYVQFQSMNGKQKFLKAMDIGCWKRCRLRCSNKLGPIEHKYIAGDWPDVESATDPTLILWQNLGKGKISRCGRGTISIIFSILLLLGGFLLIVLIMNEQKAISVDTTECGEKKVSFDLALEDY